MDYSRTYKRVTFTADTLAEAVELLSREAKDKPISFSTLDVSIGDAKWGYEDFDEFLAAYRRPHRSSEMVAWVHPSLRLGLSSYHDYSQLHLMLPDAAAISRVSRPFESVWTDLQRPLPPEPPAPPPEPPVVFIGHGGDPQWRDLKDHLHELHHYKVEAYETGSRSGHTIRDILDDMLVKSSIAFLVMTGEDQTAEGGFRARQNVIHETGLFQGRLGHTRAIVLVEEGVEDYSNLQGVQQIRFGKGTIRATFGDVLAAIRREFPTT